MQPEFLLTLVGLVVVMLVLVAVMVRTWYRRITPGQALVINKVQNVTVSFTGGTVLPIHSGEVIDVTLKPLSLTFSGKDGVVCGDNLRADVSATFFVRVNPTAEDVLRVATAVGCARAGDPEVLQQLFFGKFGEALRTTFKRLEFAELMTKLDEVRDLVIETIGEDLTGYVLEDVAFDHVGQTPVASLDPNNVLDAEGIRRITEIITQQATETARIKAEEKVALTRLDHEAKERELELRTQIAVLEEEIAKLALGTS